MNKKAVEGLPLKYIIIAIIASMVVGILINVTNTIGVSVENATGMFVAQLQNLTNNSLG